MTLTRAVRKIFGTSRPECGSAQPVGHNRFEDMGVYESVSANKIGTSRLECGSAQPVGYNRFDEMGAYGSVFAIKHTGVIMSVHQSQMDAVDNSYLKQSDPRMPVLAPERSTRSSFGK